MYIVKKSVTLLGNLKFVKLLQCVCCTAVCSAQASAVRGEPQPYPSPTPPQAASRVRTYSS